MDNFNQENESEPVKSNSKLGLIIAIICLIAVICGAAWYIMQKNNPKSIYNAQIDKLFAYEEGKKGDVTKANVDFGMNVDTDIENDLIDLINDTKISVNVETSESQNDAIVGLKLASDNKNIFDADVKLESESKNAYVKLGDLYKKTVEVDASEIFESMDTEVEDPMTFLQKVNLKKAELIAKKTIKDELKDEYFTAEQAEVEGEKLKKNILSLTSKQAHEVVSNICTNLSNNKEFLECFEDQEEVKNTFKEIEDQLKDAEEDDLTYEVAIYTKGFKQEIKKVDVAMKSDDQKATIEIRKVSDEDYTFKFGSSMSGDDIISGDVKYQKLGDNEYNLKVSLNSKDADMKLGVDLHIVTEYADSFSDFDTSNSVKLDEISDDDMMEIYNNLMESDLYTYAMKVVSAYQSLMGSSYSVGEKYTADDFDFSSDDISSLSSNETSTSKETSTSAGENSVTTLNDDVINFEVPNGYEKSDYSSTRNAYYTKTVDNSKIEVSVNARYINVDDYMEEVDRKKTSFEKISSYKNVEVSEPEDVQVNGKTFKMKTLTFEYEHYNGEREKKENKYYIMSIDDKNSFVVQVDNYQIADKSDIETFLKIK